MCESGCKTCLCGIPWKNTKYIVRCMSYIDNHRDDHPIDVFGSIDAEQFFYQWCYINNYIDNWPAERVRLSALGKKDLGILKDLLAARNAGI